MNYTVSPIEDNIYVDPNDLKKIEIEVLRLFSNSLESK